jgi:hypothetical protein
LRRLLLPFFVFFLLIFPVQGVSADHINSKYGGIMPDSYYRTLATCETGKNWKHSTLNYTGGLGIYRRTAWRWSGHRNIGKFSARKQVQIADRIAFRGWTNKKGQYVAPVGPWGWGCIKLRPSLQRDICKSKHQKVQKWKRNC